MRPTKLAVAAAATQVQALLQARLPGKSLSMLLAVGLWIALANAALAGPVSSTTTTTVFGATTTTTTTTTSPPTTATAPPTTTTTTPTTTTTTTTIPGDLSGQYPFLDKKTGDSNESYMNVDTALSQICVAGAVREIDATVTYNRSVTFSYTSNGTITKASDKKVDADFGSVELTLIITELVPASDGGPVEEYNQTITIPTANIPAECKLKASLKQPKGPQSGERALDRVKLDCDLGENFSAFPDLTDALIANIQDAFAKRKQVKADSKNGKLKIKTNGSEVLPGDSSSIDLSCTLAVPTTTTTAPTTTSTTATTAPPTTSTSTTTSTTDTTTTTTLST